MRDERGTQEIQKRFSDDTLERKKKTTFAMNCIWTKVVLLVTPSRCCCMRRCSLIALERHMSVPCCETSLGAVYGCPLRTLVPSMLLFHCYVLLRRLFHYFSNQFLIKPNAGFLSRLAKPGRHMGPLGHITPTCARTVPPARPPQLHPALPML